MKNLQILFLLSLILGSCNQSQTKKPVESATTIQEKQLPIFTPSNLPYPFSTAVQVGDILYLSGEIGFNDEGNGLVPGGIEAETERIFERIEATLAQHGLGIDDVFKCTVMLADMSEWPAFNKIYASYFEEGKYPTRSAMGVNGLALGARVEMEVWAYIGK